MNLRVSKQFANEWMRVKQQLEGLEQEYSAVLEDNEKSSQEATELRLKISRLCNEEGMKLMEKGDVNTAGGLLRRAEALSEEWPDVWSQTMRNLACFYGKTGKLFRALGCLDKVAEAGTCCAKTHLNYTAILSQLGRHKEALTHCLRAVYQLQNSVLTHALSRHPADEPMLEELSMSYYNLAVEHEFLQEFSEAQYWYSKGLSFAQLNLPPGNPCRVTLTQRGKTLGEELTLRSAKQAERRKSREKQLISTPKPAYLTHLSKKIQMVKGEEWRPARSKSTEPTQAGRVSKVSVADAQSVAFH